MYPYYRCPFRTIPSERVMQDFPIDSGSVAPGGTTSAPSYSTGQPGPTEFQQNFVEAPGSPVQQDIEYTQGYLRTQIGKNMLVSFLIGTNTYQDRTGVLEKVGISYIILKQPNGDELLADIYSIKFVRIYNP